MDDDTRVFAYTMLGGFFFAMFMVSGVFLRSPFGFFVFGFLAVVFLVMSHRAFIRTIPPKLG